MNEISTLNYLSMCLLLVYTYAIDFDFETCHSLEVFISTMSFLVESLRSLSYGWKHMYK